MARTKSTACPPPRAHPSLPSRRGPQFNCPSTSTQSEQEGIKVISLSPVDDDDKTFSVLPGRERAGIWKIDSNPHLLVEEQDLLERAVSSLETKEQLVLEDGQQELLKEAFLDLTVADCASGFFHIEKKTSAFFPSWPTALQDKAVITSLVLESVPPSVAGTLAPLLLAPDLQKVKVKSVADALQLVSSLVEFQTDSSKAAPCYFRILCVQEDYCAKFDDVSALVSEASKVQRFKGLCDKFRIVFLQCTMEMPTHRIMEHIAEVQKYADRVVVDHVASATVDCPLISPSLPSPIFRELCAEEKEIAPSCLGFGCGFRQIVQCDAAKATQHSLLLKKLFEATDEAASADEAASSKRKRPRQNSSDHTEKCIPFQLDRPVSVRAVQWAVHYIEHCATDEDTKKAMETAFPADPLTPSQDAQRFLLVIRQSLHDHTARWSLLCELLEVARYLDVPSLKHTVLYDLTRHLRACVFTLGRELRTEERGEE